MIDVARRRVGRRGADLLDQGADCAEVRCVVRVAGAVHPSVRRLHGGLAARRRERRRDHFVLPSTKAALALLDQHKIRYTYEATEDGHTWPNWRVPERVRPRCCSDSGEAPNVA